MRGAFAVWLVVASLLAGCGDNDLGPEKVRPNQAPETVLSSGPPDSTSGTLYRVHLYWSGTDRDGTISHYDFILVDHPPIRSHIDGDTEDDDPSRVIVEVPAPDDPRWTGTASTDSIFITLADSLHRDPRPGPGENGDDVRDAFFERWHTFFVRAVDNEGMPDPTPDYRSFNARNIAPTLNLLNPVRPGNEFTAPPVIIFNWDGQDAVDRNSAIEPVASRYVIISSRVDISRPVSKYVSYPDSLYILPKRYSWSPWRRWDALDGSGKRAVVSGLNRVGEFPGAGYYIFAAQALDEAGAITPVFDWASSGKNNVCLIRVSGSVGPVLTVRDEFLGTQTFVGGSRPIQLDVAAGQRISFRWSATADHYGGEIVAYRYGWDIRNTENDQEWSSWSSTSTSAPARSFSTGSRRFFLQTRDNAESITQAIYELSVHTVTRARDLLLVDDSNFLTDVALEMQEKNRWLSIFGELASENGFLFDSNLDVFDVQQNRMQPPPIQKVFDYKAIVWTNRSGGDGSSALQRVARFYDPIPTRNQNTAKAFNYINIYLANDGRLWVSGFRPARQLWPPERDLGQESAPVNVTNWDDPLEPHPPGIDSVGTSSLLYKMGVEMFDVGAATDIPRFQSRHFCRGLRRCATADSQRTESTRVAEHSHLLAIASVDVESFVPQERVYLTTPELEHRHSVTLTTADFISLRQGGVVTVETSEAMVPQVHHHTFTLVDQQGVWGAPILAVGPAWSQGGTGARPNIEIYNMPNLMAQQAPPLIPLPGVSIAPYCYISGVVEDTPNGITYPATADNQPAFILAKGNPLDPDYTRAFCGFEPFLLEYGSHKSLAQFVLVRHFRLGTLPP